MRWANASTTPRDRPLSGARSFPPYEFAPLAIEKLALRKLVTRLGGPPVVIVLWDGSELQSARSHFVARVRIRSRRALFRLLSRPSLEFGECYCDGSIDVEGDLVGLLEAAARLTKPNISRFRSALESLRNVTTTGNQRRKLSDAREHYELGTAFFQKWLDSSMVYTCAYFDSPEASLEDAQRAKLDLVCRKLALRPDEAVVDAGCGWGSLALYMAEHYGVRVKAFNISADQLAYARSDAKRRGLARRVEFIEDDYRNIRGRYDAFVSIGMLEHVGAAHYRELGALIRGCLDPSGRGILHSIGRDRPFPTNAWIQRRIFPGGYTPSLREMLSVFEPNELSVLDVENLRPHYVRTLDHWLHRFETETDALTEEFGEQFIRTWRLYLAGASAAFRGGWLQLFQVTFSRSGENGVSWKRTGGNTHNLNVI